MNKQLALAARISEREHQVTYAGPVNPLKINIFLL